MALTWKQLKNFTGHGEVKQTNDFLSAAAKALKTTPLIFAKVSLGSNQSVPTAPTFTTINFDVVNTDEESLWSSADKAFVVPAGYTKMLIQSEVAFWPGTGGRQAVVRKNGASFSGEPSFYMPANGADITRMTFSGMLEVTEGEKYSIQVYHSAGSNIDIGATSTWFSITLYPTGMAAIKGDKGDPFVYADFTPEQLAALEGEDGYTPVKGVDYFDGNDGAPGADGYTPVKGVDYFDGEDGYTPIKNVDYFDGADGYTPIKGVDYFDGADAPQVEIEYSADGSSWHKTYNSADIYVHFSTDGGSTWGDTVRIRADGDFVGPASATADNFVSFADTTGKAGKDSGKKASDFATADHTHAGTYEPKISFNQEKSGESLSFERTYDDAFSALNITGKTIQNGTPTPSAPINWTSAGGCNLLVNTDTYAIPTLNGIGAVLDTYDVLTDTKVARWAEKVFNGTESFGDYNPLATYLLPHTHISPLNPPIVCTHFVNTTQSIINSISWVNALYVAINYSYFGSVANLKSFLAAQYAAGTPVKVLYQLATPVTTPGTPQTVRTFAEQTNVTQDNATKGTITATANVHGHDSAWDGEHLYIGAYHLWVDATGNLRIKSGAPTSDTDGTIIGTQS